MKEAGMSGEGGSGGDVKIEDIMRPADAVRPDTLARDALKVMRETTSPALR
jgi:CBS domain-containing protein